MRRNACLLAAGFFAGIFALLPVAAQYAYAPAYGVGAAPAQAQSPGSDLLPRMDAKLDKILKLLEDVAKDEPDAVKPGGAAPAADALAKAATACAACHAPAAADEKGGGFVLFEAKDGDKENVYLRSKLPERDRRRLVSLVTSGKMPPPPAKLSEAERAALLGVFDPK